MCYSDSFTPFTASFVVFLEDVCDSILKNKSPREGASLLYNSLDLLRQK